MVPLLEVLGKFQLPWWCYARADALVNLSESSWKLVRRSGLRMAYIGAESPSDWLLHEVRKGTRTDQTLEAVGVTQVHQCPVSKALMGAPQIQDPPRPGQAGDELAPAHVHREEDVGDRDLTTELLRVRQGLRGVAAWEAEAGPLSPANPATPVPAMVRILPFGETQRTR